MEAGGVVGDLLVSSKRGPQYQVATLHKAQLVQLAPTLSLPPKSPFGLLYPGANIELSTP